MNSLVHLHRAVWAIRRGAVLLAVLAMGVSFFQTVAEARVEFSIIEDVLSCGVGAVPDQCTVSPGSQSLAQDVLDYRTRGLLRLNAENSTECTGFSPGALVSIQRVAGGVCAETCPGTATNARTTITPSLLGGMINVANAAPSDKAPRITWITGGRHSAATSLHYVGRAFDMGCKVANNDPWAPCSDANAATITQASGDLLTCAVHNPGTADVHYHCSSAD